MAKHGVKILGTSLENLNRAEDRKEFEALLRKINVPQPQGKTATSPEEALANAAEIGYPGCKTFYVLWVVAQWKL